MAPVLRILVLALLPVVAHASLSVGPAIPVSAEAERSGAFRPQSDPAVAWNGTIGIVVWRGKAGQSDFLLGTRVDVTGRPVDPTPFIILKDKTIMFARVAALGSRFLVVWLEADGGGTHAAFIESDGTITRLALQIPAPFYPNDLESNGSTALLAGNAGTGSYEAVLYWIDGSGRIYATRSFGGNAFVVDASSDGIDIVVAWWELDCATYTCDHTFFAIETHSDGSVGPVRKLRFADDVDVFAYRLIGFKATRDRLLLLFNETRGVMTAMLFDRSGNVLTAALPVEDPGAYGAPVAVASDGRSFLVAYPHIEFSDSAPLRSTRLRRVDTSGVSDSEVLFDDTRNVVLQSTGSSYLLVRSSGLRGASDNTSVSVSTLTATGTPASGSREFILSRAPDQQDSPAAVFDGTAFFTAWEEFFPLDGLWRIRTGNGQTIAESSATQRYPRVVFDGARFLTLWTETERKASVLRARRVNRDGSPAGTTFSVSPIACGSRFDAALTGTTVTVAFVTGGCGEYGVKNVVNVATIAPNDIVSIPLLIAETQDATTPVIASSGPNSLVVWNESVARLSSDPCPFIYEYCPPKQVLNGAVIEAGVIRRIPIAGGAQMLNREPQIAWNGHNYLVAWIAAADVNAIASVTTQLFASSGEAAAPPRQLGSTYPANGAERRGSVSAFGSGFIVAWERSPSVNDLWLWRINADGGVGDSQRIEADVRDLRSPQLVPGGTHAMLLYAVNGPDESYFGHNRIVSRVIGETIRRRAVTP